MINIGHGKNPKFSKTGHLGDGSNKVMKVCGVHWGRSNIASGQSAIVVTYWFIDRRCSNSSMFLD